MSAYRALWQWTCVLLGVTGTAAALTVSPAAVAVLFVVFGCLGSLLTMGLISEYWELRARGRLRLLAVGWLVAGTSAGAFIGYASFLGPGVLLLSGAALGGSPSAVKASRRWLRSIRTPTAAQLDAVARAFASTSPEYVQFGRPELRDLTDEQLCRRWRASCKSSQRRPSAAQLVALVGERQTYLDELERRNAKGFAAWLVSGPQTEDPLPYLTGDAGAVSTVDWDELTRGTG
jgi:hypothetical protein